MESGPKFVFFLRFSNNCSPEKQTILVSENIWSFPEISFPALDYSKIRVGISTFSHWNFYLKIPGRNLIELQPEYLLLKT